MISLIDTKTLSNDSLQLVLKLKELGLLSAIENECSLLISTNQFLRLKQLVQEAENNQIQTELFPMYQEIGLGKNTILYKTNKKHNSVKGLEVLIQLLPIYLKKIKNDSVSKAIVTTQYKNSSYELRTTNKNISNFIDNQIGEFFDIFKQRTLVLTRSATYQGSKASFAPAICEIIKAFTNENIVVVDLMCGAGSVSGALSHYRRVIASDAQYFSLYLAKVQGGGMDVDKAKKILSKILCSFANHFELLQNKIQSDLEKENEFLLTEISENLCKDFTNWVVNYQLIGNKNTNQNVKKEIELRKINNHIKPGILFTSYYANLFFGVLQSAEIDSLRMAIFDLENPLHKQWALGVLTATVSYCAYSYAGHFAQPKMRLSTVRDNRKQIREIFKKRNISVRNEFSARFISLAEESEKISHSIQDIEGSWKNALLKIDELVGDNDVLVYLDPPYTRDEFSRYYHVLETLIHYNYPDISGNASIPLKGSKGRFRSSFFTRNISDIENLIVEIITECLNRKWKCLWSYSTSGMADIAKVLLRLEEQTSSIDIFSSNHSYSPQGKQKAKQVVEYFILFTP